MEYYNDLKNVRDYIQMCEGYDGHELIGFLRKYLKEGASLLELGMGPGTDLDQLKETYQVTGSDRSQVFLDLYRQRYPGADLLLLDAVTLETDKKFDCIYSNKVLHHLTREELKSSLARQKTLLRNNGLLFHTFWKGDKEEEMHGMRFVYYTEELLTEMVKEDYAIISLFEYKEMEPGDSMILLLKAI